MGARGGVGNTGFDLPPRRPCRCIFLYGFVRFRTFVLQHLIWLKNQENSTKCIPTVLMNKKNICSLSLVQIIQTGLLLSLLPPPPYHSYKISVHAAESEYRTRFEKTTATGIVLELVSFFSFESLVTRINILINGMFGVNGLDNAFVSFFQLALIRDE